MPEPSDSQSIQEMMADLRLYQEQQSAEIKKLQGVSNIISFGLAAILLAFIGVFFNTVSSNFAPDRVTESVERHVPEMLPDLANGAMQLVTRVYPTYAELVQKEAIDTLPELTAKVETEADKLIEGLHKGTEARLHKAILTAFTGEGKPLRTAFPKATPEDVTKALETFSKEVEEDLLAVTNEFLMAHMGEILTLQKTMSSFDTKGLPNDEIALSKRLVHSLLALLDQEIMEAR